MSGTDVLVQPVREGAGYAGAFVSAAVDGLRSPQAIVAIYAIPS